MKREHLIANTGIQFLSYEVEFNPMEPLLVNKKKVRYSFAEVFDPREGEETFSILCYNEADDSYYAVDELLSSDKEIVQRNELGVEQLDAMGVVRIVDNADLSNISRFRDSDKDYYSINSLQSFLVSAQDGSKERVVAFEKLLDHWLPMPMFKREVDGISTDSPMGWCRLKISRVGKGSGAGMERFRLVYAFDTTLASDKYDIIRPYVSEYDEHKCEYCLCNKADLLINFLSSGDSFHAFADYLSSLFGIATNDTSRRFKAYYIYFVNFLRLSDFSPEVVLYSDDTKKIDVDLVLDIGNSRTCGILFEKGDFTRGTMLALRNLSDPHICYENKTFDMRVVFRRADFGNDIILDEDMFVWSSFVRVGEEARQLVYSSVSSEGLSAKTTHYSSPKRYLWDHKEYDSQWENLITTNDSTSVSKSPYVADPVLSDLFAADGTFFPDKIDDSIGLIDHTRSRCHYSRASLMTFAFIEIFHQALLQVNSPTYRSRRGDVDVRRVIRNIIITCPPAMPLSEQIFLRQSAVDAFTAITKCIPTLPMATITPSPEALRVTDPYAEVEKKVWKYDEASCCQLVYLYAEIAERYKGDINKFFKMKGRQRETAEGTSISTLMVGTIDIGAGTTDLMVCQYDYDGSHSETLCPQPLFYDSFYLAGDDILRNIVQNVIIEGSDSGAMNVGNISSALTARICAMTDDELRALPCNENKVYEGMISRICNCGSKDEKERQKVSFAGTLLHDFFGKDSAMMGSRDREIRNDFNTQVSVPMAQMFLELLRTHRPSKLYSFDELFSELRPAEYLLDAFAEHFGFRFESLSWRYDDREIAAVVKSTMESLLRQLALVLYSYHCDVVVLSGRPTSLNAITELFIKYLPVSPDRLICLNDYRVGSWFPTADGQGYFYDQKAIVAVGAMIGFLSVEGKLDSLVIDFNKMIQNMTSTANYIGEYNSRTHCVSQILLTPSTSTSTITLSVFPSFLGCRQIDADLYTARPLYAVYNHSGARSLTITISRSTMDEKECLQLECAFDENSNDKTREVELIPQSLVDDGKYWLDKGEFELTIK